MMTNTLLQASVDCGLYSTPISAAPQRNTIKIAISFQGFFGYLNSKGYDAIAVALSMKKTNGHHKLAHMALKGPPNFVDRNLFL